MKKSEGIKKQLFQDWENAINYVPNRNTDIYHMINNYLSDFTALEEKEPILKNLANCIQGQPYEQPANSIRSVYTRDTLEQLKTIFSNFEKDMSDEKNTYKIQIIKKFSDAVYFLNQKQPDLLDTWRRENISDFINAVKEEVSQQQKEFMKVKGLELS